MPLTDFQRQVALLLAAHRNPESHVAGGAVINRADESFRYSDDLDIFHDVAQSVAVCAEADASVLLAAGFSLRWTLRQEGFFRAEVKRNKDSLRLDWAADSPFRFFPVEADKDFGYCLQPADLAVNKILALAGRREFRDFLDILYLDSSFLSLGAIVWAACGKDPGYTPALLLGLANRHSCFQNSDLQGEMLARPVDFKELKMRWLQATERAQNLFLKLPAEELGCLYVDAAGKPLTPDADNANFSGLSCAPRQRPWGLAEVLMTLYSSTGFRAVRVRVPEVFPSPPNSIEYHAGSSSR